jgi:hypothetical protein
MVTFGDARAPEWVDVHIRLPGGLTVKSVKANGPTERLADAEGFRWLRPAGTLRFEAGMIAR